MRFGTLTFTLANQTPALVAEPVKNYLATHQDAAGVWASAIDPTLSDTAAFCEHYGIGLEAAANCVVVEAKRADKTWYAACLILATTKADVNGTIRRELNARKLSFAPMDMATSLTRMEYGGITPIGLPGDWPILIDSQVAAQAKVIIGSGIRGSKLLVAPEVLAGLPNAKVMDIAKG
jgi:prolyl-tRNA editing enzyme YbaK/EbsC (Cys-tRNA(Pro) deacylase)